ncbi:hypothetical protein K7X08_002306 [Anisodus acutangulus]|uniref:Uncharacterized protein n=1 Tax=Anisodus acutangulus TaxID=402998 RepID=A0A9Q1R5U8_9SOLA|nr:hypothetical protein K7X08_002306 [Anisodus acutangulus]
MFTGYSQTRDMSAMVTALTHVVSGRRPGEWNYRPEITGVTTSFGGGSPSSSSSGSWAGQKRRRDQEESVTAEQVQRVYGGFGEFTGGESSSSVKPDEATSMAVPQATTAAQPAEVGAEETGERKRRYRGQQTYQSSGLARDYWEYSQLLQNPIDFHGQHQSSLLEQMFLASSSMALLHSHTFPSSSSSSLATSAASSTSSSAYPLFYSAQQSQRFFQSQQTQQNQGSSSSSSNFPTPFWTSSGHYPPSSS